MAENTTTVQEQVKPKVASFGKPVNGSVKPPEVIQPETVVQDQAQQATSEQVQQEKTDLSQNSQPSGNTEMTKEQTDNFLKDIFGDAYTGDIEALKNNLAKPAAVELTPEQKKAKDDAFEQRLIAKFLTGPSATVDAYASLKQIANTQDIAALSKVVFANELREQGFSDADIEAIAKDRYFQYSDEEIDLLEDESLQELAKRKRDWGKGRYEGYASSTQKSAKDALDSLRSLIESEDAEAEAEKTFSSNVDEVFSKLPKEMLFELGEVDNQPLDPIKFTAQDSDLQEVAEMFKNPEQRNKILYKEDGSLNVEKLAEAFIALQIQKSALRTALLDGGDRQVKDFEKRFPARNATEVGLGGGTQTRPVEQKGKAVRYGASTLAKK